MFSGDREDFGSQTEFYSLTGSSWAAVLQAGSPIQDRQAPKMLRSYRLSLQCRLVAIAIEAELSGDSSLVVMTLYIL